MKALVIVLIVLATTWLCVLGVLLLLGRRTGARRLLLLLPSLLVCFRGLLKDPRVPRSTRWLLWAAVLWVVSPFDLIPEFIPILGPLDDLVVAVLVLRHLLHRAGAEVIRENWHGDEQTLALILRIAGES